MENDNIKEFEGDALEEEIIDENFEEINDANQKENEEEFDLSSWEKYGFLYQIDEELKIPLVLLYEEYLKELTNDVKYIEKIDKISHWSEVLSSYFETDVNFDVLELTLFPLIKRVFMVFNGDVTWDEINTSLHNTSLLNFHKTNENIIKQFKELDISTENIDYEATLCAIYSDLITAKIMIQRNKNK